MIIYHFNIFEKTNTNTFWTAEWEKYGHTKCFDIRSEITQEQLIEQRPDLIVYGGSVKKMYWWIKFLHKQFPDVKTILINGDGYNFSFFFTAMETMCDAIFVTDKCHIRTKKYHFYFHPAPNEFFNYEWTYDKIYPISFVGNNYDRNRALELKRIRDRWGNMFHLFGEGWNTRSVNWREVGEIAHKSWVTLGDPAGPLCFYSTGTICRRGFRKPRYMARLCRNYKCGKFRSFNTYQSNRFANNMSVGAVLLLPFTEGLEEYVKDRDEVVFYKSSNERDEMLSWLLQNPEECKRIATRARACAVKLGFSFEKTIEWMLKCVHFI